MDRAVIAVRLGGKVMTNGVFRDIQAESPFLIKGKGNTEGNRDEKILHYIFARFIALGVSGNDPDNVWRRRRWWKFNSGGRLDRSFHEWPVVDERVR